MVTKRLTCQSNRHSLRNVASALAIAGLLSACGPGPICAGSSSAADTRDDDRPLATVSGLSDVSVFRRDDGGSLRAIAATEAVLPSQLEFYVHLRYEYSPQAERRYYWPALDWLISPAMACSQVIVEPRFVNKISRADLTSNAAMAPSLPARSSLAGAFDIEVNRSEVRTDEPLKIPLSELGSPEPATAYRAYVLSVSPRGANLLRPEEAQSHQFTFSITLDDDQRFSASSEAVRLLPPT